MQFAKDGALYVLEYGQNWFAQNEDARLSRIEFNAGNRKPVVQISADKVAGAVPLKVNFSSVGTKDYDGDVLSYEWSFAKGAPKSKLNNPSFTFTKPGIYQATLKVKDTAGNISEASVEIKAGNDIPKVALNIKGNKTIFQYGI